MGGHNFKRFLFLVFFLILTPVLYADDAKTVMVALGDSTTAGAPSFNSPAEYPPEGRGNEQSQYLYWVMQEHPEWWLINRGVTGERTDQMLDRFESDVLAYNPRVLIVLAGVNDIYQGYKPPVLKKNLKKIYRWAMGNNIHVLACTILPYNGATPGAQQRMKEVNKWILAYSEAIGAGYCDTYKAMTDKKRGTLISTADGLHPDVEGYKKLGRAVTACLEDWVIEVWGE